MWDHMNGVSFQEGNRVRLAHLAPGRYRVCANPGSAIRMSPRGLSCRDVFVTPGSEETVNFDDSKEKE